MTPEQAAAYAQGVPAQPTGQHDQMPAAPVENYVDPNAAAYQQAQAHPGAEQFAAQMYGQPDPNQAQFQQQAYQPEAQNFQPPAEGYPVDAQNFQQQAYVSDQTGLPQQPGAVAPGQFDPSQATQATQDLAAQAAAVAEQPAVDQPQAEQPAAPATEEAPKDASYELDESQLTDVPDSVDDLLHTLVTRGGSDLHCKVGSPPRIRVDGGLARLENHALTGDDTRRYLAQLMGDTDRGNIDNDNELDFGHSVNGLGRFRVNAYLARGSVALAVRKVPVGATPLSELGLPAVVGSLALEPRGLVCVTGPTGSGKTTTLASMVDLINMERACHIITIEDPIEVLHPDKKAMINQREMRHDTDDFPQALRAAMRQDPDVILVGEMRDEETVRAALKAASTGHFVMSTLHTTNAQETIGRIIDFFPPHEQAQARIGLSVALRGVICQRLVPRPGGSGRQPIIEVMVNTNRIAEAIADRNLTNQIGEIIQEDEYSGMQTFDQHLCELVETGQVDLRDALQASSNPHDLTVELRARGIIH